MEKLAHIIAVMGTVLDQLTTRTAFKSLLKTEENIVGRIFNDPNARVIWFDAVRWDYLGSPRGKLITWFVPA